MILDHFFIFDSVFIIIMISVNISRSLNQLVDKPSVVMILFVINM